MINDQEKKNIQMVLSWGTDQDLLFVIRWCGDKLLIDTKALRREKERSNKNAKD